MNSKELRDKFLDFFSRNGHIVIPSALLLPENDPSVLFTTAGMQQFKSFYSKPEDAPSARLASSQFCLRTSDIDEVGDDTHLTFFEMLGNFSFGYPDYKDSYFKKEAIGYAWEFLTQVLKVAKERIACTYFKGEGEIPADEISRRILREVSGFPPQKIKGSGKEETFWGPTGEEGPCGPTVEFYIDGIEIWNLVFNQFYYKEGKFSPLKFQGVDTGMGLERLLVVLSRADNIYKTDLLNPLIDKLVILSHKKYENFIQEFRIIADHLKAAVFILNEEVAPSNKDRGYVLRRLIRRAVVKAQQVGITENFTANIAKECFEIYTGAYSFNRGLIIAELEKEERRFRHNLKNGLRSFDQFYNKYLKKHREEKDATFPIIGGKFAFDMFQSYGFPLELTLEEFRTRGMLMIEKPIRQNFERIFEEEYKRHQELSRTASIGMFRGGLADAGEMAKKYHTATHLLHAALRKVLGGDVDQRGSNITAERLRFDFAHPRKTTPEQIKKVEDLVNKEIKEDLPVRMEEMTLDEAKKSGALGVFENKYGDRVKVYSIGDFSREICGGPHATRTGALGCFKIVKEESSSAGVRRIKAVLV